MNDIVQDKLIRLEQEVKKYELKLSQMMKDWSESKGGSRYGDEYLEIQIKVYQSMILEVRKEIVQLKKR